MGYLTSDVTCKDAPCMPDTFALEDVLMPSCLRPYEDRGRAPAPAFLICCNVASNIAESRDLFTGAVVLWVIRSSDATKLLPGMNFFAGLYSA
jgi:hypothetical protein